MWLLKRTVTFYTRNCTFPLFLDTIIIVSYHTAGSGVGGNNKNCMDMGGDCTVYSFSILSV